MRANTGDALLFFGHAVAGHALYCHRDRHPGDVRVPRSCDPKYVKAMRLRKSNRSALQRANPRSAQET
jgi:hypothetical protein